MLVILADTPAEVKQQTQDWLEWELNRLNTKANHTKGKRARATADEVRAAVQEIVSTYRKTGLAPKRTN